MLENLRNFQPDARDGMTVLARIVRAAVVVSASKAFSGPSSRIDMAGSRFSFLFS